MPALTSRAHTQPAWLAVPANASQTEHEQAREGSQQLTNRTWSVSSIRSMNCPPCFLANNALNNAVRSPPRCRNPVGDGANRTRTIPRDCRQTDTRRACMVPVPFVTPRLHKPTVLQSARLHTHAAQPHCTTTRATVARSYDVRRCRGSERPLRQRHTHTRKRFFLAK